MLSKSCGETVPNELDLVVDALMNNGIPLIKVKIINMTIIINNVNNIKMWVLNPL